MPDPAVCRSKGAFPPKKPEGTAHAVPFLVYGTLSAGRFQRLPRMMPLLQK